MVVIAINLAILTLFPSMLTLLVLPVFITTKAAFKLLFISTYFQKVVNTFDIDTFFLEIKLKNLL